MIANSPLHDLIRNRRSVRRFKSEPIDAAVLERILQTAIHAPSAHNRQPWRFVVVTSQEKKAQLADSMAGDFARDMAADGMDTAQQEAALERSRSRITLAPAAILLCADMTDMDEYPDDRRSRAERVMAVQSVSNAGAMLLLGAHAEGLAGVWMCAPLFAPESVRVVLQLPGSWEPQALLLIGSPAEVPPSRPRHDLAKVTLFR